MSGFAIAGIIFVGILAYVRFRIWLNSAPTQAMFAYQNFAADLRRRGVPMEQGLKELTLRHELVKVRRLASARVAAEPRRGFDIMKEEIDAAVARLATVNKHGAYQFKKASQDWQISDILYPEVLRAFRKAQKKPRMPVGADPIVIEDVINAMRTPR